MHRRIRWGSCACLCIVWAVAACAGGKDDPGPHPGGGGGNGGSGPNTDGGGSADSGGGTGGAAGTGSSTPLICRAEGVRELRLDELSSVGFIPNDVLQLARGKKTFPLEWQAPFGGSGELEIEVEPTGVARFVHRVPPPCADRVEIDVGVKVAAPDGAIAETFASYLFAYTSDIVRFDHEFDAAAIQRISDKQPGTPVPERLQVPAVFTKYGAVGLLYASWTTPPGPPPAGRSDTMAAWPFVSKCSTGVPILYPDVRPSIDDLLEPLRGAGRVVRADGSMAPMTLSPRAVERGSCYRANSIIEADDGLEALVELDMSPRPDKTVTLTFRIAADLQLGRIGYGEIRGPATPCNTPGALGVADFIAQCGDWGVDLAGYDGAYMEIIGMASPTAGAYADVLIYGRRGTEFVKAGAVFFGGS